MTNTSISPFVWATPIQDPMRTCGREEFTSQIAQHLKSGNSVSLFGARGQGKTTFLYGLKAELMKPFGTEGVVTYTVYCDLDKALSPDAFGMALVGAVSRSNNPILQSKLKALFDKRTLQMGAESKRLKLMSSRERAARHELGELAMQVLDLIADSGQNVCVMFDEFQRLHSWPEEKRLEVLGHIRSSLFNQGEGNISVVFTGSLRAGLALLLQNSQQPIFDQARQVELPPLSYDELRDYLEFNFEATGRTITDDGLSHILLSSRLHPKRTLQLAHEVWQKGTELTEADVKECLALLVESHNMEFGEMDRVLASGSSHDHKVRGALFLLADHGPDKIFNLGLIEAYGIGSTRAHLSRVLKTMQARALTYNQDKGWHLTDPFHKLWLQQNSPFIER